MVGIGELIKQRKASDLVGVAQHLQVVVQGIGVAGDINNIVLALHLFHRFIVQPGAWRIDQHGTEIVAA